MEPLLSRDIRWHALSWLPAKEILYNRLVCREWKLTVDNASQTDWKRLYHQQVRDDLCVSVLFDWRAAAVIATQDRRAVVAACLWKNLEPVRVVVPWISEECVINGPLLKGIERRSTGTVIDFIYNKTFMLRGLHRTCLRRHTCSPCRNCDSRSKQRCLNPQYQYFLRHLTANIVQLDECLGYHLIHSSLTPIVPTGTKCEQGTRPTEPW